MKLKLLLSTLVIVAVGIFSSAQSTINITTTGGSFATEKWVSITDMADGAGTQIWGQGDGTYGNAQGLINQDIMLAPGTYWVNCYDRYADGWDGTTIDVTAYGASIGNNGGVSPDDGTDNDAGSGWETPADELEASFMIVVPSPPSCTVPTAIVSSNITAASADFSWTASASEVGGYNWEVVPQGDAQGVNVVSSGTTASGALTVTASGLSSTTPYDFYISTDCGATGMSTWAGPVVFTTSAVCGDTVYDTGGVLGDYSSSESYIITYLPDTAANVVTLDFTLVDLENCCDTLTIYDGLDTSAAVLEADLQNPAVFTALNPAGAITIEFTSDSSVTGAGWEANYTCTPRPSCVNVTAVSLQSAGSDSLTLSWTENNIPAGTAWEVVAVASGAPAPVAGTSNATTNPYTITSLTANTSYDVYVRADCSMTFVGPISLTTACATLIAPYTQDFENAGAVPNCWTLGGDEDWVFNLTGPNHVGNAGALSGSTASGNYYAVLDDSSPDAADGQLNSPLVDVSGLSAPALSFYEISDNEGNASATLTVSVWDGAAWNVMGTYNTNTAGWELKVIDLSTLTFTGAAQARFSIADSGSFYDDIAIDDVSFNELPTCSNVNAVTVDSVTTDSATLSWTENNIPAGTAWEVVAVPAGDPAPVAGTSNATTNPYTIASLTANTSYDVYVRADCSTSFVGPISLTTSCAIVTTYPYTTDFNNNAPNACWDEAGSGEIVGGPMTIGSSDWRSNRSYEDFAGTVIPSNAINLYSNNDREWLLSEQYDMTGTSNDVLSIEVAVTNWNSVNVPDVMGSDDQVDLLITTDAGMTWTSLITWTAANQPAVDGTREFIDLSSYTGTVQFAFFASDGAVNDPEDYDFHVGMFIIDGTAGNEDVFESTLSLYPNPVNGDVVTISMDQRGAPSVEVVVFNTLGQQVMTRSFDQVNHTINIDNISSLSKGMYFVKLSSGTQQATLKFIKE
ncbi:MAG: hypothetical protein ACJAWA_001364 [Nonlabens sp.]|jgi:hypothetical protein